MSDLNRSLGRLYASEGRPSIPPEQLLSALLLQVFYGIRSERQLMEQLDYNLLYRWFVGLSPDDPVWDPTTFTKNRERLQNGDVFTKFMTRLLNHSQVNPRWGLWWVCLTGNRRQTPTVLLRDNLLTKDPFGERGWGRAMWTPEQMKGKSEFWLPLPLPLPPAVLHVAVSSMADWRVLVNKSHGQYHTTKWVFASATQQLTMTAETIA